MTGSNRRPPACKAGALPAELIPQGLLFLLNLTVDKSGRLMNWLYSQCNSRKEVIQPHLPIRLPCYDFTPVTNPTLVSALLTVKLPTSGKTRSHGVTGGVYKTRERIHRDMLIRDY